MQESVSMNARKCVHECKKVCPWMQESVSMNARKCVHECKKVCPWMQESVSMHKSPTHVSHSRMNQAKVLDICERLTVSSSASPQVAAQLSFLKDREVWTLKAPSTIYFLLSSIRVSNLWRCFEGRRMQISIIHRPTSEVCLDFDNFQRVIKGEYAFIKYPEGNKCFNFNFLWIKSLKKKKVTKRWTRLTKHSP